MPRWKREPLSENVATIEYDTDSSELFVTWKRSGKTSIYEGVPPDVADTVAKSWSVGAALNEQIKGKYPHRYSE